jgi:hypothetical protein
MRTVKQYDREAQTNFARQIAAQEISKADPRPWVVTDYAQTRRGFEPSSLTEAVARQMLDAAQAFEGMPGHLSDLVDQIDPATYRDIKARAFAAAQAEGGQQ